MITVIGPNMGTNALGRALVLAELAKRLGHEVQIIGSLRKNQSVWGPARNSPIPIRTFPLYRQHHYLSAAKRVHELCASSDAVIISKSTPTSLGLALMAGVDPRRSILDIDDWEMGFRLARYKGSFGSRALTILERGVSTFLPWTIETDLGVWLSEEMAPLYPWRTVSNEWLASRFGGHVVRHARDETVLDPLQVDSSEIRREISATNDRVWVGFIGTPRTHKGVNVLIDALAQLKGKDAPGLMLFGFDETLSESVHLADLALQRLGADRLRVKGFFPLNELPAHVSAPDIICVPSVSSAATQGQIPAKLFDAMAMGKPVVVSDVNDMSKIVGEAGLVVPPEDSAALSAALNRLAQSPELRQKLGTLARQRFLENDSFAACAKELSAVLTPLLESNA